LGKLNWPFQQWFWTDWFGDADVQALDHSSRCVWFEMLGRMWESSERGVLLIGGNIPTEKQLARSLGFGSDINSMACAISEIESLGLFSRREDGAIFSRRIIREISISEAKSNAGSKGGRSAQAKMKQNKNPACDSARALFEAETDFLLEPNGYGYGNEVLPLGNTSMRDGKTVMERIIESGPEKWKSESVQITMKWREWSKDIPREKYEYLVEQAMQYRSWSDDRLKREKIEPMSCRNWMISGEWSKLNTAPAPKKKRLVC